MQPKETLSNIIADSCLEMTQAKLLSQLQSEHLCFKFSISRISNLRLALCLHIVQ
jgi:hypothetical protein